MLFRSGASHGNIAKQLLGAGNRTKNTVCRNLFNASLKQYAGNSKHSSSMRRSNWNNNSTSMMLSRALSTNSPHPMQHFEFTNLVEMHEKATKLYPTNPMFGTYDRATTEYEWVTFEEFGDDVNRFRRVLKRFNVGFDDKVAMISNNRVEWAMVKYGLAGVGAQLVPMYEAQLEKDWKYIIKDSNAKMIIAATEEIYERVKGYIGTVGDIETVLCMEAPTTNEFSLEKLLHDAREDPEVSPLVDVDPHHVSVIIYTSGTTGNPKGVELTHDNIVSCLLGAHDVISTDLAQQRSLAFLPWAHIYGMTAELHAMTATGSARAIVPNRDLILECMLQAKPTCIMSVPALFNRIYDGVMKGVSAESATKQKIVHYALDVARRRNHCLEFGEPVSGLLDFQFKILDKIVLSKIRGKFGGCLEHMSGGGAATSLKVLQFFEDIGIPITEGYGLTETSPMITVGTLDFSGRRLGCVGVPLPGMHVRIIDPDTLQELPADTDGEITVSGRIVMKGYRNNPEANAEAFYEHDGKRYFRTGDLGQMVEGKFLKITGRIKEQFKLENGKFVVPAPLEDAYARNPHVAQVLIYGVNRPHTVALVVPSWPEVAEWYAASKTPIAAPMPSAAELADPSIEHFPLFDDPAFIDMITEELGRVGSALKSYEKPTRWLPLSQPFTQENHMMTPKMSLRRQNIVKAYMHLLEDMYENHHGHHIVYK